MHTFTFITLLVALGMYSLRSADDKPLLDRPYSFIIPDGEITRLEQRGDTLFFLHSTLRDTAQVAHIAQSAWYPSRRSRIHAILREDSLAYVALERLDSVPLSRNPFPEERYSVIVLKKANDQDVGFVTLSMGLTKNQLDSAWGTHTKADSLFFLTYFSDDYWKQLSLLNPVKTEEDVKKIQVALEGGQVKQWMDLYRRNPVKEMYGTGVMTEMMNRICISLSYNPIGATHTIQQWSR